MHRVEEILVEFDLSVSRAPNLREEMGALPWRDLAPRAR